MLNRLQSYLYIAYFFCSSAFLVLISLAICLITKGKDLNRRAVHMYSCWWGFHYIQVNPGWKYSFEGLENIEDGKTYVLVANHQSLWDIMVLYGLNKPYKWVSKESIFKIPFIGYNMKLNEYVTIKRGDIKSVKEMMNTCKNWLKQGASIMIFPEGTRSEDGELQEFRDGPFKMASDCKVPVIPIVVDGTHELLPKGSMLLKFDGNIKVRILPPVYPENFADVKKLRDHVRDIMSAELDSMRGRAISGSAAASEQQAQLQLH